MNKLAEELNTRLAGSTAEKLLSELGKRLYFPKGIISQSAEAKQLGKRFNATIGMATSGGVPLMLSGVKKQLPGLTPGEAVAYAPTGGDPALRKRWKAEILRKNPSLGSAPIGQPVVVPGLTAGIWLSLDLFLDPADAVIAADPCWDNYSLIVEDRKGAKLLTYPYFDASGGFNIDGLEKALKSSPKGKAIVILNFPNNPTGYSPNREEASKIIQALVSVAKSGKPVLALVDDAYFGLFYEPGTNTESLFASLASAHENILALKIDGSTKEDFVWGFRTGFVTPGGKGMTADAYEALDGKFLGAIRSSVSCCSTPAQSIMLKAMDDPDYEADKANLKAQLAERYRKAKAFVDRVPPPSRLKLLPFNSGYFMSFECVGISAEALRLKLLKEKGIGTISLQDRFLRVAYSSVDAAGIEELYGEIYAAAGEL
jgi:aspartate/methionine/tyrosine aminotransferase